MVKVGLLVRLEAKAGKEDELGKFLAGALPLANQEAQTTVWFALKIGPSTFGIFDGFPSDQGRTAHIEGQIAAALFAKAPELLAAKPTIEKVDILAAKF
jgi:quinol monooxygenase YgiN